jgi:hypothetical protein
LLLVSLALSARPAFAQTADASDVPPATEADARPPETPTEEVVPAPAPPPFVCPICPRPCPHAERDTCERTAYVPLPYPGCAPGYVFDGYYCRPATYESTVDPSVAEEAQALAVRVRSRMQPKFTLDLQGGFALIEPHRWSGTTSVAGLTGAMLFGYRRNYQPRSGLLVRGGPILGFAALGEEAASSSSSSSGTKSTTMSGFLLEVVPYYGPFGRFYVGPSAFLGYVGFFDDNLWRTTSESAFHLSSGVMLGAGFSAGLLLGDREQTDINASLRVDCNPDHNLSVFLMAGIGYHDWSHVPGPK